MLDKAILSAQNVLANSFGLGKSGRFSCLVICDDSTQLIAEAFVRGATAKGLRCICWYVPFCQQLELARGGFPKEYRMLLENHDALVSAVTDDVESTAFRRDIAFIGTSLGRSVGGMPGITNEIFEEFLGTDFRELQKRSTQMMESVQGTDAMKVVTFFQDTRRFELELTVAGRPWHVCNGVIPAGTYSNLPSGEVYVAPMEMESNGEFCLSGSFPGRTLPGDAALLLTFEEGILAGVRPLGERAPLFSDQFTEMLSQLSGGEGCKTLCELGIGLNPDVAALTGVPLVDEKKYSSVHIALGDNTVFGGQSKCDGHLDLVSSPFELYKISADGAESLVSVSFGA